jgi:hypothetical protein
MLSPSQQALLDFVKNTKINKIEDFTNNSDNYYKSNILYTLDTSDTSDNDVMRSSNSMKSCLLCIVIILLLILFIGKSCTYMSANKRQYESDF